MTTHNDLIARLREMAGRLRLEAADAIESLEQQVAALTSAVKDAEVVCDSYASENQRLSDEKDALTKEQDALFAIIQPNTIAHDRLKYWVTLQDQLAAAQAREAKLRKALELALAANGYGYDACRCAAALHTVQSAQQAIENALALPTDDSALQERLKQERERAVREYIVEVTGAERPR